MKKHLLLPLFLLLFPPLLHAQTVTYSGTNIGIGSTSPSQVLDVQGTVRATSFSGYFPYVKVSQTVASGTNGGAATTGSWQTRILNTIDTDTQNIASLSSNEITLPAGTYLVNITAPFMNTNYTQARLQNITTSTTLLFSYSSYIGSANVPVFLGIRGLITLTSTSTLAIQYQCNNSANGEDLGNQSTYGTEVYTVGEFTKIN